jgi:rhodanese-related sulfurtransferase
MAHALFAVRTGCLIVAGFAAVFSACGCTSKGEQRLNFLGMGVDDSELRRMAPEKANEVIAESWENGEAMELIILDARPVEQWQTQRIAGARNLQLGDVRPGALLVPTWEPNDLRAAKAENAGEARSDRLADYDTILIYGADPSSATPYALAKKLRGLNYTKVYILEGGLYAWRASGGEVISSGE